MSERTLTSKEINRQDFVDNAVFDLLRELAPNGVDLEWDIEKIGDVRDMIRYHFERSGLMTESEFYPYLEAPPPPNMR